MTQDLYYYESGYIDTNYFVYTADAESIQTATTTVACDVSVIKDANAALTAIASVTVTISHIEGADLFAFTNSALAAEVSRIRDNNIAASSAFSIATDASRTRHYSSDELADFTITVASLRVRFGEAAVDAAFSLTADLTLQPGVVVTGSGSWSSQFDIDAKGTRKTNIVDCDVTSAFTQTTAVKRSAGLAGAFESQINQQTDANRLRNVSTALSSAFNQTTAINETTQLSAVLTATANLSATISHIEGADLLAFTNASLSASANRLRGINSSQTATASINADLDRIKRTTSAISATSSVSINADKLKDVTANLTSTSTLIPIYLSYKNRHNHSAYIISASSATARLRTDNFKYATGSFWCRGTVTEATTLQVQTLKAQEIQANQDFYISIWMNMGSISATTNGVFYGYVNAGNWSLGYRNTLNQSYATIQYNGSSYLSLSGAGTSGQPGGWSQWEFFRSGSTLTFRFQRQNGTQVSTSTTYSGAITTGALDYIWFDAPGEVGTGGTYFDEFYMAKGISAPVNYKSSGEIFDGALSTTEFLFHFNENFYDELAGPTEASASLSAQASQSVGAIRTARASSSLTTSVILSASADAAIRQASANLSANGFIVAATGRIRPEVAALDSSFVLSASVDKIKRAQASLTSQSTLTASALDLDLAQANLTSAFALTAQGDRYKVMSAGLTSASTVYARPSKTLATWSSDSYFRGINNVYTFDVVNDGNYLYEVAKQSSGNYIIVAQRDINRGLVNWKIKIPYSVSAYRIVLDPVMAISGNYLYVVTGWEFNLNPGYEWSQIVTVIDTETGAVVSSFNPQYFTFIQDIVIDNGYIYLAGDNGSVSGHYATVVKYSMSGVIQWKKTYYIANTTSEQDGRIWVQGSDVYWTFALRNTINQSTANYSLKLSASTGAVTWARTGASIKHVDANANLYFSSGTTLAKVNSAGTTEWAKALTGITSVGLVTTDENFNVYAKVTQSASVRLLSLDSTGAVIWGKQFDASYDPTIVDIYVLDDRLIGYGDFSDNLDPTDSLIFNVPAIDGGGDYSSVPFPTAYHAAGSWSYTDYTPSTTTSSYTIPTTTSLSLIDASGTHGQASFTAEASTDTAFTYLYVVNGIGTWTSTSRLTANNRRLRNNSITATSQFTQTTQALKKVQLNASLSATTSQTTNNVRTRIFNASVAAQATLSGTGKKFVGYTAALASTATVACQPNRLRGITAAETSAFTQTANNVRTRAFDAAFTAFYTELTAAYRNATGTVLMETSATMTVNARKTTDSPQYLFSQTTMTAQGFNTQFGSAQLTATSTFTLTPTYLRRNEVYMTSSTALSSAIGRIRPGASSQAVQFFAFPATDNSKITGYRAALTSTSQVIANNQILRLAQANLQSTVTIPFIYAGVLVRTEAFLQVNGFQLTAGQVINIDLYYQLKIPSETRTLWIEPESRILSIDSETRVNKIKGYPSP